MTRTPYLYHWTHDGHYETIRSQGLLTARATGPQPVVWLCSPGRIAWALDHAVRRHEWPMYRMMCFCVRTAGLTIVRTGRRGIYLCRTDIPPSAIAASRHVQAAEFEDLT